MHSDIPYVGISILAFLYFGISSRLDISGIPFAFKSFTIAAATGQHRGCGRA